VTVRQTDDRQTDHAAEKCVGRGGIASAARPILSTVKIQHMQHED